MSVPELLEHVAADVVIPLFRRLGDDQVFEKGPGDLVTVADREAEERLTAGLQALYPGCVVVGEEATAADPSRLSELNEPDQLFVVDPIDGTRNFVNGNPDHAMMIAEVHRGQVVRSWIYQPQHHVMFEAESGGGVLRDGEPLVRTPSAADPAQWRGVTARKVLLDRPGDDELAAMTDSAWCCGVDYPRLASGEIDFVLYRKIKPWDHLPGSLLVTETGGVMRLIDGVDYRADSTQPALLAAGSPEIWEHAHRVLFTGPDVIEV